MVQLDPVRRSCSFDGGPQPFPGSPPVPKGHPVPVSALLVSFSKHTLVPLTRPRGRIQEHAAFMLDGEDDIVLPAALKRGHPAGRLVPMNTILRLGVAEPADLGRIAERPARIPHPHPSTLIPHRHPGPHPVLVRGYVRRNHPDVIGPGGSHPQPDALFSLHKVIVQEQLGAVPHVQRRF